MTQQDTIITYTVTDADGLTRGRGMTEGEAMKLARALADESVVPLKLTITKVTYRATTEREVFAVVESEQ